MMAKQMLDAFSETLMEDERILSPRERELLANLLQNCKATAGSRPEIHTSVSAVIARSVGETVAQRAFSLLGESILERILSRSAVVGSSEELDAVVEMNSPQPPRPTPQPPTGSPQPPTGSPQPPHATPSRPADSPQPPTGSTGVRIYGLTTEKVKQHSDMGGASAVAVLEEAEIVRAQSVVLDEFLAPNELEELTNFALQHQSEFETSEVIAPSGEPGVIDYEHRRSRVLMNLGKHQEVILERVRGVLPGVLGRLGMEIVPVSRAEAQMTASNDGDFFRAHADDADASIASRRVTFVYFFHRDPKQFDGGELRLHDTQRRSGGVIKAGSYQSISPRQNQIVFFPCSVLHEITPVKCPSKAFADSRFTLNGWLHS